MSSALRGPVGLALGAAVAPTLGARGNRRRPAGVGRPAPGHWFGRCPTVAVPRAAALLAAGLSLAGCSAATSPGGQGPVSGGAAPPDVSRVQTVVTGLRAPWGLGFLPGGDALVTERDTARVLRIPAGGGRPVEVTRIQETAPAGEGGLLGLAVSPTYDRDGLVYVYVTTATDNRILRFRLDDPSRTEVVLDAIPSGRIHNGGRLVFGPDGMLYAGTGEAGNRALAQDPQSLGGKVLRMTPDGRPPPGATSVVYSLGHRNVQGLAFDSAGRLWQTEFGQNRFDEVNLLTPGSNGGWPDVEGPGDGGGRYLAPSVTWTTSQASPSGAAVAAGSLWVAALRGERLWRVPLDGDRTGPPQSLFEGRFGRLRTVTPAPDGSLWVLTSNTDGRANPRADDDRILRLPLS